MLKQTSKDKHCYVKTIYIHSMFKNIQLTIKDCSINNFILFKRSNEVVKVLETLNKRKLVKYPSQG